jgi:iron complex transport system substrate-binding protein
MGQENDVKKRIWAVLTVAVLALAACGDDDDNTSGASAEPDSSSAPAASGEPVVIEHRYGSTTIEEAPERIVSYDSQWTDVLAALDAPVVGALFNPYGPRLPWQEDILADAEELAFANDGVPFEKIASLRPDLIVVSWEVASEADYERLSQIAPTIPLLGDDDAVDAWQDMANVAGRVLGKEDEAAQMVDDAEQESAEFVADVPGLDGKTYVMANYVSGQGIWLVADPDDGADVIFGQLGMEIAPQVLALPNLQQGRAQVSVEQIQLLDADYLVLLANGTDPATIPGYSTLPVVKAGAVSLLDLTDVSGLNTPSPLSIPYVLDLIRPELEVAAG